MQRDARGLIHASAPAIHTDMSATKLAAPPHTETPKQQPSQREQIFDAFRRWGYLQAQLDPLDQYLSPANVPELDLTGPDAAEARRIYSSTIGVEFMHIPVGRAPRVDRRPPRIRAALARR